MNLIDLPSDWGDLGKWWIKESKAFGFGFVVIFRAQESLTQG
jgi:hypothetical protein